MRWELFRSLLPRWNFFDHASYRLILEVKPVGATDWLSLPFSHRRTLGGLFVNPQVTQMHAEMSLLENFVADLPRLLDSHGQVRSDDLKNLTTFRMVRDLVISRLTSPPQNLMQFQISIDFGDRSEVVFISDVFGLT